MRLLVSYFICLAAKHSVRAAYPIYYSRILFTSIVFFFFSISTPLFAAITAEKTPSDVYFQVELLADDLRILRKQNNITSLWPRVKVELGREPRHVFQKELEILGEINSYHLNILKTGGITVPRFPSREITPNEVYRLDPNDEDQLNDVLDNYKQRIDSELGLLTKNNKVINELIEELRTPPAELQDLMNNTSDSSDAVELF